MSFTYADYLKSFKTNVYNRKPSKIDKVLKSELITQNKKLINILGYTPYTDNQYKRKTKSDLQMDNDRMEDERIKNKEKLDIISDIDYHLMYIGDTGINTRQALKLSETQLISIRDDLVYRIKEYAFMQSIVEDLEKEKLREYEAIAKKEAEEFFNSQKPGELVILNSDDATYNEDIVKSVIERMNFGDQFRYTLKVSADPQVFGYKYFTLSQNNGLKLIKLINEAKKSEKEVTETAEVVKRSDKENITESDVQMVTTVKEAAFISIVKEPKTRVKKSGAFFPYLNTTTLVLNKYQIFKKVENADYSENCLIYALRQSEIVSETTLNSIKSMVTDRHIPVCKLAEVAKAANIIISLKHDGDAHTKRYGDTKNNKIQEAKIGLLKGHYFLNDMTNVTSYAIKNYNDLKDKPEWNTYYKANMKCKTGERFINSYTLIKLMLENNLFRELTFSDEQIFDTQYYTEVKQDFTDLSYNITDTRYMDPEIKEKNETNYTKIYAADFETTTEGSKHEAYMCCVIDENSNRKSFISSSCGAALLNHLESGSLTYFHNLGYDASFFIKYLNVTAIIKSGSQIKLIKGIYKKKRLEFKDSYAMISEPLRKFSSMFNLSVKKEVMPYGLYTQNVVCRFQVELKQALEHIKENEKELFLETAKEYITCDNMFKHIEYAEFYCMQDCEVLIQGLKMFKNWIEEAFNLNIYNFVSLPSLANRYVKNKGCFRGCYQISGLPRMFIQKAIVGGRVMTRDNKKWHIKGKVVKSVDSNKKVVITTNNKEVSIVDFDGVSLYPSAMHRMGFLKGIPNVLQKDQLNMEFLNKCDGYFVEITNIKLGKHRHFPLRSENISGNRNYTNVFTQSQIIDKIALEDLIKYQDATFDIVKGYYYNSGFNYAIQDTIEYCFNERNKQKKLGNPIEKVYKLILNAIYGKLGQKPIKTDIKIKNTEKQHEKFINYNYNFIKEYTQIAPGKYIYEVQNPINRHFNSCHLAAEVLSMSKRIMNEVMCLAEDQNIKIYYQDTDSMHIEKDSVSKLSEAFLNTHNRELIGDNLGQFHSDFSVVDTRTKKSFKADEIYAKESIFLGKKSYYDELTCVNEDNIQFMETTCHTRMKGISRACIDHKTKNNPYSAYITIFNGKNIEFDLSATKPVFLRSKNFDQTSKKEFLREVSSDIVGSFDVL